MTESLRPFFFTSYLNFFITFFAIPSTSVFLPLTKAVMSSQKKISFRDGQIFVTSLNASCRTIRKKQTTPLRPWQDGRDGLERLRHASFELHSPLWCSKQPHNTRNIFLGKLKCVAQAQTTRKLARSNAFARSSTKATAPRSSAFTLPLNLSISTNTSNTVRWAPPFRPSVASQSTRYFCCHFAPLLVLSRLPSNGSTSA